MPRLTYLLDEICAGLEIYYSGRTGGQYDKTSFLLCDDYVELTSKLYLTEGDPGWVESLPGGRFKSFHTVVDEVRGLYESKSGVDATLTAIIQRFKERRVRRNDFFHSTRLLDLSTSKRACVEAFKDLLDYGNILFGKNWQEEVAGVRNLETLGIMIRLEDRGFREPHLLSEIASIFQSWPRNTRSSSSRGIQMVGYPEDLYLRLCIINGDALLRDRLATLLSS